MKLSSKQAKNRDYNLSQDAVGHSLKTLNGSVIKRSNAGVGKIIGSRIYFHKNYVDECLSSRVRELFDSRKDDVPFEFNCIRQSLTSPELAFVECPDFDVSREPVVGRMFIVSDSDIGQLTRYFNQIYHHKWLWVDNSYLGFDVRESWEWSKQWLSILTERADGSSLTNWKSQIAKFGLI